MISFEKSRGEDVLGPVNLRDCAVAARASREEKKVKVCILVVLAEE